MAPLGPEPRPPAPLPGAEERSRWEPPAWPPPVPPVAVPARPTPSRVPEQKAYPQLWRAPGIPPWRPLLATLVAAIGFFVVSGVVSVAVLVVEASLTGVATADLALGLAEGRYTPGAIFGNSLGLALVIPVTFLASAVVGQRPGFLSSVSGRFRWRWCGAACLITLPFVLAYLGLSLVLEGGVAALGLEVKAYSWWLLAGLLLVTPFQAAAEEYLLRGVLLRTAGSWFASERVAFMVGAVVSSLLFMLLHGASDPWLNGFYFAMGMLLSWLAWRTGGLEASIAVHTVNNMLGLGLLPFQDLDLLFSRGDGAGSPLVLIQLVLVAAPCVLLARRARTRGIQTRTGG